MHKQPNILKPILIGLVLAGTSWADPIAELAQHVREQAALVEKYNTELDEILERFPKELEELGSELDQHKQALKTGQAALDALLAEEEKAAAETERLNNIPIPELNDRITFRNGLSFAGTVVQYRNGAIKLRSASDQEKTGKLSIIRDIAFHQPDLTPEEFPSPRKPRVQQKVADTGPKPLSAMELQNITRNIDLSMKSMVTDKDDGRERKGNTIYIGAGSEEVRFSINLKYKVPNQSLKDLSLEMYALAKSESNKKMIKLIIKETETIPELNIEGHQVESKVARTSFMDGSHGIKDAGFKYYGYLLILKDEAGNVLYTKSSHSKFEKAYDELSNMSQDQSMTL